MPELPDLEYVCPRLHKAVTGRVVTAIDVFEPIVIRCLLPGTPVDLLVGRAFARVERVGHFFHFVGKGKATERIHLIVNAMLVGRFALLGPTRKKPTGRVGKRIFTVTFDDGTITPYYDDKRMGKVYIASDATLGEIPQFNDVAAALDLLDDVAFTADAFHKLVRSQRCQIRVLLMDKARINSLGNAYADEVLFDAQLHPKAMCTQLTDDDIARLHASIRAVLRHAIDTIEQRGEPIEVKVRDFLKIRNKGGEPCPRCDGTIRRAGVLGYDTFFCPTCQPERRKGMVDWRRADEAKKQASSSAPARTPKVYDPNVENDDRGIPRAKSKPADNTRGIPKRKPRVGSD